jgi:hypothetical protein
VPSAFSVHFTRIGGGAGKQDPQASQGRSWAEVRDQRAPIDEKCSDPPIPASTAIQTFDDPLLEVSFPDLSDGVYRPRRATRSSRP